MNRITAETNALILIWSAKHILHKMAALLTKHSPRRHRFSVQPERHLGENDCHDAREVRLDDKVADLPLQMEMSRHHGVFTYGGTIQGQLTEQHSCHSNHRFMQTPTPGCVSSRVFFSISAPCDIYHRPKIPLLNFCLSDMMVLFFFSFPFFSNFVFFSPLKYSTAHNQCHSHVSQKATVSRDPDGCRL